MPVERKKELELLRTLAGEGSGAQHRDGQGQPVQKAAHSSSAALAQAAGENAYTSSSYALFAIAW
jgi:hypothetical protein